MSRRIGYILTSERNSKLLSRSYHRQRFAQCQLLKKAICTSSFYIQTTIDFNLVSYQKRLLSSTSMSDRQREIHRLEHIRNVGVFAHVDAGKTTVTERMLALAGIVQRAGSVDTGNTVTDFLPQERERGITIQSAAISFGWKWHNKPYNDKNPIDDEVTIHLIDTPGHVDFSVEVNRSVAVLDAAVLVVDAVAGVQAQTETVWRAITRPSMNNHESRHHHIGMNASHEPLSCIAFVNKMDKIGCNFGFALSTLKNKLPGANPVAIQVPLFQVGNASESKGKLPNNIIAVPSSDLQMKTLSSGHFVGVIDLLEMRAIVWPDTTSSQVSDVEECIPTVYPLLDTTTKEPLYADSQVVDAAIHARHDLVASLADVDESMEEYFLMEDDPSNFELRTAIRNATLSKKILPVMTGAALRGKGVEPLLDAMADFLPSPLDRKPPALISKVQDKSPKGDDSKIKFGHPLHPYLLALAFKVVHMKNRGGSGDGRVVFARIYSGQISSRDSLIVTSPPLPGEKPKKPLSERVGGMLELMGGSFNNLKDAVCYSGDVCALVGLKNVTTGDTIMLANNHDSGKGKKDKRKENQSDEEYEIPRGDICLAGVGSPKPVLTVRLEAESSEHQSKLTDVLNLLSVEDPSLKVEETGSTTLVSGLGELHIEIIVDRIRREHGLEVWIGKPSVAYREGLRVEVETAGLVNYDRTVGSTRMQASIHLRLQPVRKDETTSETYSIPMDPIVKLSTKVRSFLGFSDTNISEEQMSQTSEVANALISGCRGAMKRGPIGAYEMANITCYVEEIDADGGLSALNALPGVLRAASSTILASLLNENKSSCSTLEPIMSVEISVPVDMVGTVLSDLTTRRGTVGDVIMGDSSEVHSKAMVHGSVPLSEILGYANSLRSITAGEGSFSAEYEGHAPFD